MKVGRLRGIIIKASMICSVLVSLLIVGLAHLALKDAKSSILEDVRRTTAIFAARAGTVMFPKEDKFFLHVLVHTLTLDKIVEYAVVTDRSGKILSHSDADRIGVRDMSPEGVAARRSDKPIRQDIKGPGGLQRRYFSNPITVGKRRLGTAAVAVDPEVLEQRLAAVKRRLLLILAATVLVLVLLAEIGSLARKVERASELKSALIRTVSHEFNNALSVFDSGVYLLKDTDPEKEAPGRRELYDVIADRRKSLGLYVKNILNEARIEAGRFRIEKRPLALRDLMQAAVQAHDGPLRARKIAVTLDLPDAPVLVDADPDALAIVAANLIGNAVKYTPDGGSVRIRLLPEAAGEGTATLYVENSGSGISEKDLRRLKEEFFRTRSGEAAASGFGLGLTISDEMLALHGSRLEIASESGKSSTFYFTLPMLARRGSSPVPKPAQVSGGPGGRCRREAFV